MTSTCIEGGGEALAAGRRVITWRRRSWVFHIGGDVETLDFPRPAACPPAHYKVATILRIPPGQATTMHANPQARLSPLSFPFLYPSSSPFPLLLIRPPSHSFLSHRPATPLLFLHNRLLPRPVHSLKFLRKSSSSLLHMNT